MARNNIQCISMYVRRTEHSKTGIILNASMQVPINEQLGSLSEVLRLREQAGYLLPGFFYVFLLVYWNDACYISQCFVHARQFF